MKTVYSYDYHGKLIGPVEAELCQVTEVKKLIDENIESVFILPAFSTEVIPPEFDSSVEEVFFNGEIWEVKQIPEPVKEGEKPEVEKTYVDKRREEYPSIFDYLDGVVKNDTNQINKYIADCKAVKAKYPKPKES